VKSSLINECKKIYCCEPNPNCIKLIKKYYGDNDKLILNEYAISDNMGLSYLKLDINNNVSGSSQLINAEAFCKENNNLIEVRTNTFANFIKDNDIKVIDFLKVDCEGGENFIFNKDNIEFIKNNVKKIALEYHNGYKDEIKKLLIDSGFFVIEDVFAENFGFLYASKFINIVNESGSLGDTIAWTPIVNKYAEENKCKVNFFTPYKDLFINSYPMINFFDYELKPKNDSISIGCFDEKIWRPLSLQQIACDILKLENKEVNCKLDFDKNKKSNFNKKYVCIATQSTLQCKYWNNKNGWIEVVNYLNKLGYDVVCIDRHESFGLPPNHMNNMPQNAINKTGDFSLHDRINDLYHCEFFIGLGSGLSWLAWACEKPVIMISGFSDPKSEFNTPYRVHNKNVCNSCWNDSSSTFEKENWLWCPKNKDFECSREITFDMVKEKIDLCIQDLSKK
jgi:autotransporter strand-loop-strand O-heptosyltransferase